MLNILKLEINVNNLKHITNTYLVYNEELDAVLIDPADSSEKIIKKIEELKLNLKYVFITHGHADHIGALNDIIDKYHIKCFIHKNDYEKLFDNGKNCSMMLNNMYLRIQEQNKRYIEKIDDGTKFSLGNYNFLALLTKGHTSGSMCLYVEEEKILFTGDTIFHNCYGRCDLYSSSFDDMILSLRKIFDTFENEKIIIYPGHNESCSLKEAENKIKLLLKISKKITL